MRLAPPEPSNWALLPPQLQHTYRRAKRHITHIFTKDEYDRYRLVFQMDDGSRQRWHFSEVRGRWVQGQE